MNFAPRMAAFAIWGTLLVAADGFSCSNLYCILFCAESEKTARGNGCKLHIAKTVPAVGFACGRVKGKQVRVLYDPVTVSGERLKFSIVTAGVNGRWEGVFAAGSPKPGNLPFSKVQESDSRSRGLGRTDGGYLCCRFVCMPL
jgi:hypothetical protein